MLFSFNAVTAFVCPFRTSIRFPFMTENTTIVVSSDPLIMMSSSEVIVRQRTAPRCSLEKEKKPMITNRGLYYMYRLLYYSFLTVLTKVALICLLENIPNKKVSNTEKVYFAIFIVIVHRIFT